ncbi:MAG TPA: type 1 glutamine amidotransferase [Bdellovibrionota bacterium]|jgi:GMP synthase-like glutamine amidotransferase
MKALIFQHTDDDRAGHLLDWLKSRGHTSHIHYWFREPQAPSPAGYDWLIILGGGMNVDQEKEHPWLVPEKKFLKAWLAEKKPVLGICLGGQMLAQALGGVVRKNGQREVGFQEIQLPGSGYAAFARWPQSIRVYQFHQDAFTLPPGCVSLASSPACAHQAFALDPRTLGLQFHPESTADWIESNAGSVKKQTGETYVQSPAETARDLTDLLPPMTKAFHQMLDDFVANWG